MDADVVHRSVIDVLVVTTAPRCASFGELLRRLPGVPPEEAASAIDRLTRAGLIDAGTSDRLAPAAQPPEAYDSDPRNGVLPPPHPLDYDWRFTPRTAERLLARCAHLTEPGELIALLGTPTILHAAILNSQGRRWILLEASPATTSALSQLAPGMVLRCDLFRDDLPALSARVVLADPPWYPEHAQVFAWAASRLTQVGATILLAQPPPGTRPGILAERASLITFARRAGLEPVATRPGELTYLCPPFERNALRASGLAGTVPDTWRRGDLIEFRRTTKPAGPRPNVEPAPAWREVTLNGTRIRFRASQEDAAAPADPRLLRLADGDVLPSVSRRDPLRGRIAVWTCGNKVFGCRSPVLLAVIAAALTSGHPVTRAAEAHLGRIATAAELARISQAVAQLTDLARQSAAISHHEPGSAGTIVARPGPPPDVTSWALAGRARRLGARE